MLESMAQGSSDWSDLSRLPRLGKAQHSTKEADSIESKLLPKDRANSHRYYSLLQEEKLGLRTCGTPSRPCFLLATYSRRLSSVGAGVAHSLQARQMLCGAQTTTEGRVILLIHSQILLCAAADWSESRSLRLKPHPPQSAVILSSRHGGQAGQL